MNIRNILCPVDFSSSSDAALALASSLARERDAVLYIIHVEENPVPSGPGLGGQLPSPLHRDQHELWATLPSATEVTFHQELLLGDAAQEITRFASEHDVDLIVIGSHGRTGLSRMLMGSVAEAVMRRAPVPVLSVRADAKNLTPVSATWEADHE